MTKHYTDEGTLLIRNSDIKDGYFEFGSSPIYLDNEFAMENSSRMHQLGDVVTVHTGDVGTSAVIGKNEEKSIGFATIVTRPYKNVVSSEYLSTYLNTDLHKKWAVSISTGDGRTNYNLGDYCELVLPVPKIEEQNKIAVIMKNINELITLHQRKFFMKKIDKIEELSLKKLASDWEQREFSQLYTKVSEKNDLTYTTEHIISVANMYYKTDSYITDMEYLRTYNVFKSGDIAFEGNKSKDFAHGRFVENTIGNGIVSHVFDVFRPIMPKYSLMFWKYAINNERLMGKILVRCTKASTMMTNLVAVDFLKEYFLVPTVEEQEKIGIVLDKIDRLITLHQRE